METTDNWVERPQAGTFTYKRCAHFYQRWDDVAKPAATEGSAMAPKPVVVLLHGFMQSSTSWDVVARSLQNRFCVYALDFIGHGLSEKATKPARYTYEDMAASVDYFIRKVIGRSIAEQKAAGRKASGCNAPASRANYRWSVGQEVADAFRVHVVGYSMGGRIALQLLRISSDVLASLTLESCNLGCATEEERAQATQRNQSWVERIRRDGMESFVNYWETLPLFETQKELGYDKLLHYSRAANNPECMTLCLEGAGKQAMPLSGDTLKIIKRAVQGPVAQAGEQRERCDQDSKKAQREGYKQQNSCSFQFHAKHNESVRCEERPQGGLPIHYIYGSKDEKSKAIASLLSDIGVSISEIDAGHNVHLEEPTLYCKEVQNFLLKADNR